MVWFVHLAVESGVWIRRPLKRKSLIKTTLKYSKKMLNVTIHSLYELQSSYGVTIRWLTKSSGSPEKRKLDLESYKWMKDYPSEFLHESNCCRWEWFARLTDGQIDGQMDTKTKTKKYLPKKIKSIFFFSWISSQKGIWRLIWPLIGPSVTLVSPLDIKSDFCFLPHFFTFKYTLILLSLFLVADTRLYTLPCRSVGR